MLRYRNIVLATLMPCVTLAVSACNNPFSDSSADDLAESTAVAVENSVGGVMPSNANELDLDTPNSALAAVFGASEIPYPVYPNGQKYRVGGENGLKIVVFQTDDDFESVDDYYSQVKDNAGMARLIAMQDYVRYTNAGADSDPWATHEPGIVIHQFNDERERQAVGASPTARTNIIMSF